MLTNRKVDAARKQFKTLERWSVTFGSIPSEGHQYRAQSCVASKVRAQHIYPFGKKKMPWDYLLHELLHAVIKEVYERKHRKAKREKVREDYLRDLTMLAGKRMAKLLLIGSDAIFSIYQNYNARHEKVENLICCICCAHKYKGFLYYYPMPKMKALIFESLGLEIT